MVTRQTCGAAPVPDLLTVEEAAAVLRIGRTKAYAMAREWRAMGGRSGLPVIDFDNTLRVPRHALEQLIGAPILEVPALDTRRDEPLTVAVGPVAAHPPTASGTDPDPESANHPPAIRTRRSRRAATRTANQLDLFEPPPTSASS